MAFEARNEIRMKILADGTVSISTDAFEEEVHDQADQLIKETVTLLGGERKIIRRGDGKDHHHHSHHHGHAHNHG